MYMKPNAFQSCQICRCRYSYACLLVVLVDLAKKFLYFARSPSQGSQSVPPKLWRPIITEESTRQPAASHWFFVGLNSVVPEMSLSKQILSASDMCI